ncbi:hypothetical protein BVRB_3g065860 [Beta vulgaris subsp. vulgaris]|uniref:Uncharacterized protein n=1 Tax=Beta vulgaris subsp. vulgaris TaxID=3555 RepID=A0A0J8CMV1_BETVV|nr:hypothetical protein BVRB_3g065860 [Beta vulgaris subsp. vulgaris]
MKSMHHLHSQQAINSALVDRLATIVHMLLSLTLVGYWAMNLYSYNLTT